LKEIKGRLLGCCRLSLVNRVAKAHHWPRERKLSSLLAKVIEKFQPN